MGTRTWHMLLYTCHDFFPLLDSPMDMSIVDEEEKAVGSNEVLDYAEEIHTYLREMEVIKIPD